MNSQGIYKTEIRELLIYEGLEITTELGYVLRSEYMSRRSISIMYLDDKANNTLNYGQGDTLFMKILDAFRSHITVSFGHHGSWASNFSKFPPGFLIVCDIYSGIIFFGVGTHV